MKKMAGTVSVMTIDIPSTLELAGDVSDGWSCFASATQNMNRYYESLLTFGPLRSGQTRSILHDRIAELGWFADSDI